MQMYMASQLMHANSKEVLMCWTADAWTTLWSLSEGNNAGLKKNCSPDFQPQNSHFWASSSDQHSQMEKLKIQGLKSRRLQGCLSIGVPLAPKSITGIGFPDTTLKHILNDKSKNVDCFLPWEKKANWYSACCFEWIQSSFVEQMTSQAYICSKRLIQKKKKRSTTFVCFS